MVVTYIEEAWTMSVTDKNVLHIYEHKIVWRIYGPIRESERISNNTEIDMIPISKDIVIFV